MGIQTIEALISASGYFSKTFSCTARAPLSRHNGHVGESKAKNRIFSLLSLNLFIKGVSEFSREINSKSCFDFIHQPFFFKQDCLISHYP